MANEIKFGKSDWSEPVADPSNFSGGDGKKVDYMKLPPGRHVVRLITDPYNYVYFKVKLATDPDIANGRKYFGDKIKASMPLDTNPLITVLGLKPKQGQYAGVIDRATGMTCVLDMSIQVRSKLALWRSKKGYGDLKGWDFDVVVNPRDASSYYSVLPSIPEALSEADLKLKADFDEKQLDRLVQPINDHTLQMKWLNEKRERNGLPPIELTTANAAVKVAADDSDDVEFSPADSASTVN